MEVIFIFIGIYIVWRFFQYSQPKKITKPSISLISEEAVFEAQKQFERHFKETFLPDAIPGQALYIYRHLMLPWYKTLSGRNRYDEKMTQKLREDFLVYTENIEDAYTYRFLYLEAEVGSTTAHEYEEKSEFAARKVEAIQDAFAALMGEDSVTELLRIHRMDFNRFDNQGELAPDGFRFGLDGKLQPLKK
jgi:hypothetical protein